MTFAKIAIAAAATLALSGVAQATGSSTGTFNVTIKITGTCNAVAVTSGQAAAISTDTPTLSGADINFGSHVAATGAAAINGSNVGGATSSIAVNCSKNTPYTIAMSPTNVASTVGLGTMNGITAGNLDTITYQLYQPTITGTGLTATVNNTASSNPWGNVTTGAGQNALGFTGKGLGVASTVFPVFATVPAGSLDKFVDRYQDQVTVTLAW
ncbi:MAG: spore coat protein SpoU [Cellvibrionales bacterium]|nr:MAG: spore coat protein SpoU [Cellvibrionales bacterium]